MGCYLNDLSWPKLGKADAILKLPGAIRLNKAPVERLGYVGVCVVTNGAAFRGSDFVINEETVAGPGAFDAAAVVQDERDLVRFNNPEDDRPKVWIELPLEEALKYADYDWRKEE